MARRANNSNQVSPSGSVLGKEVTLFQGDLEKEKKRLQNILATGQEGEDTTSQNVAGNRKREVKEETDRYQEVLDEIQERRQFLADMASLGQEGQYIHIMNTEISQKIRELELLNGKHPNEEAMSELNVEQRL